MTSAVVEKKKGESISNQPLREEIRKDKLPKITTSVQEIKNKLADFPGMSKEALACEIIKQKPKDVDEKIKQINSALEEIAQVSSDDIRFYHISVINEFTCKLLVKHPKEFAEIVKVVEETGREDRRRDFYASLRDPLNLEYLKDFTESFSDNNIAKLFLERPDECVKLAKAMKWWTVPVFVALKKLARARELLAEYPDEFSELLKATGEWSRFRTLGAIDNEYANQLFRKYPREFVEMTRRVKEDMCVIGTFTDKKIASIALDHPDLIEKFVELGKTMRVNQIKKVFARCDISPSPSLLMEKVYTLNKIFGIEFFERYDNKTIEHLYIMALSPSWHIGKPTALLILNKNDHNGAFKRPGLHRSLLKGYRMVVVEVEDDAEALERLRAISDRYGKLDLLLIGGHGTQRSLKLGRAWGEETYLDLSDFEQYGGEGALERYLKKDAIIVLESCSTGKGGSIYGKEDLGNLMSAIGRLTNRKVFAPAKPVFITRFVFDEDGKVRDVKWFWWPFFQKYVKKVYTPDKELVQEPKKD